ncbi:MAG: hypothetical protein H6817_09460 [Phycisphaerales bacterium]|nr:hypothetical protein [Phycisphaerales bacterium]
MIVAGIDEAGYGPLLGPLVASAVAFEVPDEHAHGDLWELLAESVCRAPSRRDSRLPIADSKKLFQRSAGIASLERTALVMLHTAGRKPHTLSGLLDVVAPGVADDLRTYPWYAPFDPELPFGTDAADIATRANAVRRNAEQQSVGLRAVYAEVLPEGHFNRLVDQTNNKATVLMRLVLKLVQRVTQRFDAGLRICIDRQGGREHYVEKLMTFFQGAKLRIVEESAARSAYELTLGQRSFTIEFLVEGETHQLPIALASVYSKYLRELLMTGLNAYFAERHKTLKPTAGYYTDAQRFLGDIETVVRNEQLDRAMLVRSR